MYSRDRMKYVGINDVWFQRGASWHEMQKLRKCRMRMSQHSFSCDIMFSHCYFFIENSNWQKTNPRDSLISYDSLSVLSVVFFRKLSRYRRDLVLRRKDYGYDRRTVRFGPAHFSGEYSHRSSFFCIVVSSQRATSCWWLMNLQLQLLVDRPTSKNMP